MKPYDTLHIKYGTWHYVENDNMTKGSIMLNVHFKDASVKFDEDFRHIWPTQHKRCRNNTFYRPPPPEQSLPTFLVSYTGDAGQAVPPCAGCLVTVNTFFHFCFT